MPTVASHCSTAVSVSSVRLQLQLCSHTALTESLSCSTMLKSRTLAYITTAVHKCHHTCDKACPAPTMSCKANKLFTAVLHRRSIFECSRAAADGQVRGEGTLEQGGIRQWLSPCHPNFPHRLSKAGQAIHQSLGINIRRGPCCPAALMCTVVLAQTSHQHTVHQG